MAHGTWITSDQDLINLVPEDTIEKLSDDDGAPWAIDSTVRDAAIAYAESRMKGKLGGRYSSDIAAGTASARVTTLCGYIALAYMARRRKRRITELADAARDADQELNEIRDGMDSIYEWSADTLIRSGKIEPQRRVDVFDGAADDWLIASDAEHDDDER